jgi:hypothetical protein
VRQLEGYSAQRNAGEGAVKECKRVTGHQMYRTGAPLRLWDDYLDREALVGSATALDIYSLCGETLETMLKGGTRDISTIVEYTWYGWTLCRAKHQGIPNSRSQLGRDIGTAIYIGPAMSHKILKPNGHFLNNTRSRQLTPDEEKDPVMVRRMKAYNITIKKKIGRGM